MSIEAVAQFCEAVNGNEEWQEEIRNFGAEDNMVDYAKGKGHVFSEQDFNTYVEGQMDGELSEFETELVAGGNYVPGGQVSDRGIQGESYYASWS